MGNKPRGFSALVFDLFFLSLPPSLNLVDCKNRLVLIQNKIIYGAPSRKSPGRFHHTHVCMQAGMRSRCTHNTHTHMHTNTCTRTHTHTHTYIHTHNTHACTHAHTHAAHTHWRSKWLDAMIMNGCCYQHIVLYSAPSWICHLLTSLHFYLV